MNTGRVCEVSAIVEHDRGVEVANLLMGTLNAPMRRIFHDDYLILPRRQLKSGKASLLDGKAKELKRFCQQNFGTTETRRLARLYVRLYENNSQLRLSLKEFAELIGQPREGVLRGAPRHSTVSISPWGLQTEYPEMHLVRDIALGLNAAIALDVEASQYRGTSWARAKKNRPHIAELRSRASFHHRMCVLSCFNLLEAYVNGVAWEFAQANDLSKLSKNKQDLLTEGKASILDKLVKVPEVVSGTSPGPLQADKYPLVTFREVIKPFRDSIVHASPFSAPERFGGYDKLSKVYDLTLETTRNAVDITVDIIGRIHRHIGGSSELPEWMPLRGEDGKFKIEETWNER